MRQKPVPILLEEDGKAPVKSLRRCIVALAQRSQPARGDARTNGMKDDLPAGSFEALPGHLATLTTNCVGDWDVSACEFFKLIYRTDHGRRGLHRLAAPSVIPAGIP